MRAMKEARKKAAAKPKAKDIYSNIMKNAKKSKLNPVEIHKNTAALRKQLGMDGGLKGGLTRLVPRVRQVVRENEAWWLLPPPSHRSYPRERPQAGPVRV